MNIIELYEFQIGANRSFFTSSASDISHGGVTYTAYPLSRTSIQSSATDFVSKLQIETERHHPIAISAQKEKIEVYVSKLVDGVQTPIWQGVVVGISWHDSGATLSCEDNLAPIQQLSGAQRFSRNCRHVLYSPECGVDINEFLEQCEVISSNASIREVVFDVGGWPTGHDFYFEGGILIDGDRKHQILSTTSVEVAPLTRRFTAKLTTGASIVPGSYHVAPGCNRGRKHCSERFDNILNFGGFAYLNRSNLLQNKANTRGAQ